MICCHTIVRFQQSSNFSDITIKYEWMLLKTLLNWYHERRFWPLHCQNGQLASRPAGGRGYSTAKRLSDWIRSSRLTGVPGMKRRPTGSQTNKHKNWISINIWVSYQICHMFTQFSRVSSSRLTISWPLADWTSGELNRTDSLVSPMWCDPAPRRQGHRQRSLVFIMLLNI